MTSSDLNNVKKQNASLVQQVASLRSECDAMRIENVSLSDNKTDMEMEMRKYEKECEDQKSLISRVEKELGKVISIRDELQKQNNSLRKQLQDCENAKKTVEKNLEDLQAETNSLQLKLTNYTVALRSSESENQQMQLRLRNSTKSTNESGPISPPNSYFASPVGVQTPATTQQDMKTPGTWSIKPSDDTPKPRTNLDPMDDQLERIQAAKERAMLILKDISNFRINPTETTVLKEPSPPSVVNKGCTATKTNTTSSLQKTEAFICGILDSCGKQTLSI
jgi:DNA repair exonuclease SbcCD ATPase subunit